MTFPLSLRKFITTEELSIVNAWLEENSDLFLQSESNDEYWNQRAIYWTLMPSHIQDILMEKILQIKARYPGRSSPRIPSPSAQSLPTAHRPVHI